MNQQRLSDEEKVRQLRANFAFYVSGVGRLAKKQSVDIGRLPANIIGDTIVNQYKLMLKNEGAQKIIDILSQDIESTFGQSAVITPDHRSLSLTYDLTHPHIRGKSFDYSEEFGTYFIELSRIFVFLVNQLGGTGVLGQESHTLQIMI